MTKEEHIRYWLQSGDQDWETALELIHVKRYYHALFFFHLTLEKNIKAVWVKANVSNTPPFTHDLVNLVGQTDMELTGDQTDLLRLANAWNIETRYPDHKFSLYRTATKEYLADVSEKVKNLRLCLQSEL